MVGSFPHISALMLAGSSHDFFFWKVRTMYFHGMSHFHIYFYFYTILNITFHLQSLQHIDYIPHIAQYVLQHIDNPTVCIPFPLMPIRPLTTGNCWFVLYIFEPASFWLYSLVCCYFLDSSEKWYYTVFIFLWHFT